VETYEQQRLIANIVGNLKKVSSITPKPILPKYMFYHALLIQMSLIEGYEMY
jgi:hypothetical protein